MAAQIVSQDFEAFLDLMVEDADKSASVTDVRAFLSLREEAWRRGDQLPREDYVEIKAAVVVRAEPVIQCEVVQISAVSEVEPEPEPEPELKVGASDAAHITPTHTPFRSLSTQTPQPGHPDYHRWIKNQTWARM